VDEDIRVREGEVRRRAGSTALPTSHRMRRLTAVSALVFRCVCVCVCVSKRERERERVGKRDAVTAGGRSGASSCGVTPAPFSER